MAAPDNEGKANGTLRNCDVIEGIRMINPRARKSKFLTDIGSAWLRTK
jgi:hypothetical protein